MNNLLPQISSLIIRYGNNVRHYFHEYIYLSKHFNFQNIIQIITVMQRAEETHLRDLKHEGYHLISIIRFKNYFPFVL